MTWDEIDAEAGNSEPQWNDASRDDYSVQDVVNEVRLIVEDEQRLLRERPHPAGAAMAASIAAGVRDRHRSRFGDVGLGHMASLYALWLVERADGRDRQDKLMAAQLAAAGSPNQRVLAEGLHNFVSGHLSGAISDKQFVKQLKHPAKPLRMR
jgi:hypothetical protein